MSLIFVGERIDVLVPGELDLIAAREEAKARQHRRYGRSEHAPVRQESKWCECAFQGVLASF